MCGTHDLNECAEAQAERSHKLLVDLGDELVLGQVLLYLSGHKFSLLLV